jgi:hypothetical protein
MRFSATGYKTLSVKVTKFEAQQLSYVLAFLFCLSMNYSHMSIVFTFPAMYARCKKVTHDIVRKPI